MPDIVREIADKVAATIRANKWRFPEAYEEVKKLYPYVDHEVMRPAVASNLGKRNKGRKRKPEAPKAPAKQMELFLGVSRKQALKDAKAHEASLTAGLSEHDL